MSTTEYVAQMVALGIGRGALEGPAGFPCEDGTCTLAQRQPHLLNPRAHMKVRAATIGLPVEDLTHLNPEHGAKIAQEVSERAKRRRAIHRRDAEAQR